MLWVNLIMDTFAALALATEPPNVKLLDRAPESRFDKIVNAVMWRNIFGQSIYQITVMLLLLFFGKGWFGFVYPKDCPLVFTKDYCQTNANSTELTFNTTSATDCVANGMSQKAELYTIVFESFVFMQCFNQINARKLGDLDYNVFAGFFNNWYFIVLTVITFAVQICMVQYAGRFATVVALNSVEIGVCLGIGSFTLIWGLIIKACIPSRWFNFLAINEKEMSHTDD